MDALLTRLDPKDDEYSTCQLALATLNKVSVFKVISSFVQGMTVNPIAALFR
jgi:hypothetical protein